MAPTAERGSGGGSRNCISTLVPLCEPGLAGPGARVGKMVGVNQKANGEKDKSGK